MLEWFQIKSWTEHLRQHKRTSRTDTDIPLSHCPIASRETSKLERILFFFSYFDCFQTDQK